MKIGSIEVGVKNKKSHFDFTHDVNTTSDFGFCQPTLVQDVDPDSTISLDSRSVIRLGNLPTSPFARMMMKQYNVFVPLKDVHMAYKEMFSQTDAYSPIIGTYVPDSVDFIWNDELLWNSLVSLSQSLLTEDYSNASRFIAIPTIWCVEGEGSQPIAYGFSNDSTGDTDYQSIIGKALQVYSGLSSCYYKYSPQSPRGTKSFMRLCNLGHVLATYDTSGPQADFVRSFARYIKPSFDNGDFMFEIGNVNIGPTNNKYFLSFNLTHMGRRLFKVFQACQIEFRYSRKVSMPLLLSYYKAWFDIFNPGRNQTWKNTAAYELIHYYFDNNRNAGNYFADMTATQDAGAIGYSFDEFMLELPLCCYSETEDALTVSLDSPVKQSLNFNLDLPDSSETVDSVSVYNNYYPDIHSPEQGVFVRALLRLVPFVNKSSVIGKQVDKFLKSFYNISLPERSVFGTSNTPIVVDDIYATAETDHNYLGELGGKCLASQRNFKSKIHVSEHGTLIQLTVIIPLGGYSQSFGNQHNISFMDFYQSTYDGMGMEGVPMSSVFGEQSVFTPDDHFKEDETFGFRPMMMSHKYRTNIRMGDFKNRSTRNNMMTYCLDRFFNVKDIKLGHFVVGSQDFYPLQYSDAFSQVVNEELRFIGREERFGNYDRIFIDQFGNTDNFLLHIVQNLHITTPKLPVSESFDTFDDQTNDGTMSVSHQ